MLNEDQHLYRTPDLVAKIRKMREAAQKEMDRFTRVDDYDVRRVVGHGPMQASTSSTASASGVSKRAKRSAQKSETVQSALEFAPAPAARGDDGESA